MYEYAPKHDKQFELQLSRCLLPIGFMFFAASFLNDHLAFELLRMIASLLLLVGSTMVMRFSRSYVYRVAPREDDALGGLDLTVTELHGNRTKVVCRISVTDITKIERVTSENRKAIFKSAKGNRLYRYVDCMGYESAYLLWTVDGEEMVCLLIRADDRLIEILRSFLP